MDEFVEYICPHCGESIQIVVDYTGGAEQQYVEDCPVCCSPNVLSIWIDRDGEVEVAARAE